MPRRTFTLVTAPGGRSTYVLKPDAGAVGGLVGVEEADNDAGVDAHPAACG